MSNGVGYNTFYSSAEVRGRLELLVRCKRSHFKLRINRMLDRYFEKPKTGMQVNFIKCIAALPQAIKLYGDPVTPKISKLSSEAKEWAKHTIITPNTQCNATPGTN